MNKIAKLFIVIGIGLMCIGVVFSLFNLKNLFSPFISNNSSDYETKEIIVTNNQLNKLIIDSFNEKIIIIPSNNNEIKITYYENEDNKYQTDKTENTFTLNKLKKFKFMNWKIDLFSPEIKVEIPIDIILDLDINTDNANIEIRNLKIGVSKFTTSNSKIVLNNIISNKSTVIKTSNGNIELKNSEFKNIETKTSNDKIILENIIADKIESKTSNDLITASKIVTNTIKLETSNDKIVLKKLKSPQIDLKTSNGKIEGNILGSSDDYNRYMKTSNGKITINGTKYGHLIDDNERTSINIINAKTSNDNINIDFN